MKKSFFAISLSLLALSFFQCKCDDDTPSGDCVCPEIYAPVCGEDGIVYDNSCYAECAGVEYTDGFCTGMKEGVIRDPGDPAVDGWGWAIELLVSGVVVREANGITDRTLSKKLKEPEQNQLVIRTVYDSFPPRV